MRTVRSAIARHDEQVTDTAGRLHAVPGRQGALHLALLDVPFTPLKPAELRDRCTVLADRVRQAANRNPSEEPGP